MINETGSDRAHALLVEKHRANRLFYAGLENPAWAKPTPSRQVERRAARANDYWVPNRHGRLEATTSHLPTQRMIRRRTEHADGTHSYRGNLP